MVPQKKRFILFKKLKRVLLSQERPTAGALSGARAGARLRRRKASSGAAEVASKPPPTLLLATAFGLVNLFRLVSTCSKAFSGHCLTTAFSGFGGKQGFKIIICSCGEIGPKNISCRPKRLQKCQTMIQHQEVFHVNDFF